MKEIKVLCDICRMQIDQKGDPWVVVTRVAHGYLITKSDDPGIDHNNAGIIDICSDNCLQNQYKRISQWLLSK